MKVTVAELKCALDRLPDPGTHRYNHLMFIRQSGHWPEWTLEVV